MRESRFEEAIGVLDKLSQRPAHPTSYSVQRVDDHVGMVARTHGAAHGCVSGDQSSDAHCSRQQATVTCLLGKRVVRTHEGRQHIRQLSSECAMLFL
jgi:hypothetical protein